MTYRCNDGGIPNPKYITTRLRLSAYSTREKLIELGLRKRGTPEEESLIEMISSLTHAKAAVLSAHGVNQSFKAIKEAAKTGDQDKWFKEHYFPMLIEAEESEQISSFRLARLIYSDGPAVARLLDGRSGLPAEKVEAIKRIANTLLEPNSSAGLIDQSEVSPYFAPEAGR